MPGDTDLQELIMGEDFDPAWEYFCPDPEIAEVMDQRTIFCCRALPDGFRFGSPNARKDDAFSREPRPQFCCQCRGVFLSRSDRFTCSGECLRALQRARMVKRWTARPDPVEVRRKRLMKRCAGLVAYCPCGAEIDYVAAVLDNVKRCGKCG